MPTTRKWSTLWQLDWRRLAARHLSDGYRHGSWTINAAANWILFQAVTDIALKGPRRIAGTSLSPTAACRRGYAAIALAASPQANSEWLGPLQRYAGAADSCERPRINPLSKPAAANR